MKRGVARLGDSTQGICTCHRNPIVVSGTIITCSTSVNANSRGVARVGDTVLADCGHTGTIITGSGVNSAEGRGVARLGDLVEGCYNAVIISASPDVTSG